MIAFKFVKHDVPALETLKNSRLYILSAKWEAQATLTRKEKDELGALLVVDGTRLGGWQFPFSGVPTWYIEQYGSVSIKRAPDKTSLRNATRGKIDRITARTV